MLLSPSCDSSRHKGCVFYYVSAFNVFTGCNVFTALIASKNCIQVLNSGAQFKSTTFYDVTGLITAFDMYSQLQKFVHNLQYYFSSRLLTLESTYWKWNIVSNCTLLTLRNTYCHCVLYSWHNLSVFSFVLVIPTSLVLSTWTK